MRKKNVILVDHKHRLRILGPSAKGNTLLFACTKCKDVHIYRKVSIYGMLLTPRRKYRKRYRTS